MGTIRPELTAEQLTAVPARLDEVIDEIVAGGFTLPLPAGS
jgi:hypothetical protein